MKYLLLIDDLDEDEISWLSDALTACEQEADGNKAIEVLINFPPQLFRKIREAIEEARGPIEYKGM